MPALLALGRARSVLDQTAAGQLPRGDTAIATK